MIVELISVGTELLLGNIVNTNAAFLAEKCAVLGLSNYYQTVVGDNAGRLKETVAAAISRSDIVIISGGLGPTEDDLTKESVAEILGKKLIEDAHSKELLKEYFKGREMTDNNWKQAMIPEGAKVIDNQNGTAPGLIIEDGEKTVILLPGPPNELEPMFLKDIFPYLRAKQPEVICSQVVKICGIGESKAETLIKDLIDAQSNPTIAPYAKTGEVHLRVTAKASTEKEAMKLIKPVVRQLKERFGSHIYTTSEESTLEEVVVQLLKDKDLKLCTVESCTGGLLAGRIVNVSGASQVLKQGMVTYSNKAKRRMVGVKKTTLIAKGAVSEQTAKEMAKGGAFAAGVKAALSVTGIAGPNGGTAAKPVGLVYIGCCISNKVKVKEYHFKGDRRKVREQAVVAALTLLRECILESYY